MRKIYIVPSYVECSIQVADTPVRDLTFDRWQSSAVARFVFRALARPLTLIERLLRYISEE